MSLEQVIQENTAAIQALIATLTANGKTAAVLHKTAEAVLQDKVEKAVADKGIAGAKEEVKALVAQAEASADAMVKAVDVIGDVLDYEKHVKPVALALANKKGRDALVAVLKTFDCQTVKDAKPEQYAGLVAAITVAAITVAAA